jgi:hypothetical protein
MIRQNAHSFYFLTVLDWSVLCSARLDSVSIHQEFCFLVIVSVVVRPNFDTQNLNEAKQLPRRRSSYPTSEKWREKEVSCYPGSYGAAATTERTKNGSHPTTNLVSDLHIGRTYV